MSTLIVDRLVSALRDATDLARDYRFQMSAYTLSDEIQASIEQFDALTEATVPALYKIKPLEWTYNRETVTATAAASFGRVQVIRTECHYKWTLVVRNMKYGFPTRRAARAKAQQMHEEHFLRFLEPVNAPTNNQ